MRRPGFVALAALACLVIGAASEHRARLAFRLVVDGGRPVDVDMLDDPFARGDGAATKIAVSREVLLDERGVASVAAIQRPRPPHRAIGMTMTPEGSETLKKITGENIGRRLAIVLDGKILIAPTIQSQIARSVEITFGTPRDDDQAAKQQREVVERIRGAIAAATTRPAAEPAPATRP